MNVSQGFHPNQPNWNGSPGVFAAKQPVLSIKHAIPRQLLLAGAPFEQRIFGESELMSHAGKKLNGFANIAAGATAASQVSFADYPHLKEAYDGYASAAGIYREALVQLEPGSGEAIRVKQLLIDAYKSCIKTIYLAMDALEKAPGEKSSLPYLPWEMRACEAIREIAAIRGPKALRGIPELRH